ncbi:MAG: helix-turn-helix domain-containing protein [Patescibacteria group bacterium]
MNPLRYRIRAIGPSRDGEGRGREIEMLQTIKWLTVRQVSSYLQISVAKIYQMAQSGEIPCCRLGQQWRFEREEIDRWLRRR